MEFEGWILLIGSLLLLLGAAGWLLRRIPFLTPAMVYLGIGAALGPWGWGVVQVDPLEHPEWLHRAAEIAVIVSLFTVGLKVRLPLNDRRWLAPLFLATVSMTLTVALVAAAGHWLLGLPLGLAVLLGAVLAPTDPVLASDVQVRHANDRDQLRLGLSIEAGLNDGTAFPFVMLGLGWLGLHELGVGGWRWWSLDVVWAISAGLVIGGALGYGVGKWLLRLGVQGREGTGAAVYLVGGMIGVSYALAVAVHAYGFLAVFATGVGLRLVERQASGDQAVSDHLLESREAEPARLSASEEGRPVCSRVVAVRFAAALSLLSEYIERLLEIGLVLLVGAILAPLGVRWIDLIFAGLILLVLRPVAVLPVRWVERFSRSQLLGFSWFGIRGIGSIYYLFFAIREGLEEDAARRLVAVTLTTIALSIVVHGASVTPLLQRWRRSEPD